MAPIPLLSVLIYSNKSQYVILKVSLKKIEQNLPIGCVKHGIVSRYQNALFYMQFQPFLQTPEHIHMGHFKFVKKVLIHS